MSPKVWGTRSNRCSQVMLPRNQSHVRCQQTVLLRDNSHVCGSQTRVPRDDSYGWVQGDELESQALAPKDVEDSRTTEAKSRAVVLEMIGDLPEAEAKPPSDMLFVCKLNPVTSEEVCCDGPCCLILLL